MFANDTQLCKSVPPTDYDSMVLSLQKCTADVKEGMLEDKRKLNDEKNRSYLFLSSLVWPFVFHFRLNLSWLLQQSVHKGSRGPWILATQSHTKTIVKRCKLQWYGHVSRSSGLAKIILQGTMKGEEDRADTGRGGKSQRTAENRDKWRKLVAKSAVVPQRPSWLKER